MEDGQHLRACLEHLLGESLLDPPARGFAHAKGLLRVRAHGVHSRRPLRGVRPSLLTCCGLVGRNSPEHIIHFPDKTFYNATLLLQHLDLITPARTQTLQTKLRRVAPFYTFSFARNASFWTLVRDRLLKR